MFATLRPGTETLQEVEQSTKLCVPGSNGPPHDACCECRQKKLKCSGEKNGCRRCVAQGKACVYVGNRYTKKRDQGYRTTPTAGSHTPVSNAGNSAGAAAHDLEEAKSPQQQIQQEEGDGTASDRSQETAPQDEELMNVDSCLPIEGVKPSWNSALSPDEVFALDYSYGLDYEDGESPMQDITSKELHTAFDFNNMGCSTLPPATISRDRATYSACNTMSLGSEISPNYTLDASPLSQRRPSTVRPSMSSISSVHSIPGCPPGSRSSRSTMMPPSQEPPRDTSTTAISRRSTTSRPVSQRGHACVASALRFLELAHSCPRRQSHPSEFLRFFGTFKRGARDLGNLFSCPTCTKSSSYLILLAVIVDKNADAVGASVCGLNHDIDAQASGLSEYGVETPEEFGQMFSPILLPCVALLKGLVGQLRQKFLSESLEAPYENFEEIIAKLQSVQQEIQDQFSSIETSVPSATRQGAQPLVF